MKEGLVRSATKKDIPTINSLCRETLLLHLDWYPGFFNKKYINTFENYTKTFFEDNNKKIFVYEENSEVKGLIKLVHVQTEEKPYKLAQNYLEIDEISVDKNARRKGIASKLITKTKEYAKELNVDSIILNVWAKNTGALALYEKIGFKEYSRKMKLDV